VTYGNFNYEFYDGGLVGYGLVIGAITKSAQLGLHSWLSRSMEGPTPVSALLHAATMVTAGVYLMLRINLGDADYIFILLAWIGGLSALSGAIAGLLEQDIKKIIAYSTISQLGYMFIALAFSYSSLSLWHLVNHACFKALLFLSGGALIHNLLGFQDIRQFGKLDILSSGLLRICFFIGNLSIMAIPFMTGWWTKDLILMNIYGNNSFLFVLIYLAALFTSAYSIKLFIASFKSFPRLNANVTLGLHPHLSLSLAFPLIILFILSTLLGYFSSEVFEVSQGHGSSIFLGFVFIMTLIYAPSLLVSFSPKLNISRFPNI
jgi:NADH-ubiquinone oxidoreductase chain 5